MQVLQAFCCTLGHFPLYLQLFAFCRFVGFSKSHFQCLLVIAFLAVVESKHSVDSNFNYNCNC
jgi:hypothetical protein